MKQYFLWGSGLLLLGALLGAGGAWWQMRGEDFGRPMHEQAESERTGIQESDLSRPSATLPTPGEGTAGTTAGAKTESVQPASVPKPEVKPAVKSAVTKANPCVAAKQALDTAVAVAQKAKDDSLAAVKKAFDDEVTAAAAQLADLYKSRTESVNNYSSAIAAATAKYNASEEPDAYSNYQKEQSAALDVYTKKIEEITAAEGPVQNAKKAAEDKYAAAKASIDIKFISDKSAAEAAYAANGCS